MNRVDKNAEGYTDQTAGKAIRKADRPPEDVTKMIELIKEFASLCGYDITNRIWLRDRKTGREYR